MSESKNYETMTTESIMSELEPLIAVEPNDPNLDQISMRTGRSFATVWRHYLREGRYLEYLLGKQKVLETYLRRYYGNELPPNSYIERPMKIKPPLKSELDMWVKSDELWTELSMAVYEQKVKVKFIEGCLERLNKMGFEVKNAIDWRKYMDGA